MDSIIECCANCRWRKEYEEPTNADVENECRRYPPRVYGDGNTAYSTFPGVRLEEWCGEYRQIGEQLPDEPGRTSADYYQQRVAELEHTLLIHQDRFRLKDERIEQLERLCCDMYRSLDKVAANLETLVGQPMRMLTDESAAKTRRDLNCYRDRMDALGCRTEDLI